MADGKGEGEPLLPKKRQRNVGVMQLVAITYFAVAGGPEGTETLIQTGGPLYSVLGFIIVGVLWSVPMALMSAELTTAFPENGGYVLWVSAAFGNQVALAPGAPRAISLSLSPPLPLSLVRARSRCLARSRHCAFSCARALHLPGLGPSNAGE